MDLLRELTQGAHKAVRLTGPRVRHALASQTGQVRIPLKDKLYREFPIPFDAQERVQWKEAVLPLCPYGEAGSLLWVRETWIDALESRSHSHGNQGVVYRADCASTPAPDPDEVWQPSSRMPRWASRVLVRVEGVRIERFQDISDSDALQEGVQALERTTDAPPGFGVRGEQGWHGTARAAYAQVVGDEEWRSNRWCWVLDYRVELIHQRKAG